MDAPTRRGQLVSLVRQGSEKLSSYARPLEGGGFETVAGDARRLARRRPGIFLVSAAAAGFAVGRLIRGRSSDQRRFERPVSPTSASRTVPPIRPRRLAGGLSPNHIPRWSRRRPGGMHRRRRQPLATERYRPGDPTVRPAVAPLAVPPDGTELGER